MSNLRTRALITGASSGVGAAYARRLARDGVALVFVARRGDRLEALARELAPVDVEILIADIGTAEGVASVEQRLAAAPEIDMLVNNAGYGVYGPIASANPDDLVGMIDLNITAVTRLAVAAAKAMAARGRGTIVNVASGLAFLVRPTNAGYSATKAYILNFTRSMAIDPSVSALTIQVLMPGVIRTEFHSRSGVDIDTVPQAMVMAADDLVDASIAGLELGEVVCLPSLPDYGEYEALESALRTLAPNLSRQRAAARYLKQV